MSTPDASQPSFPGDVIRSMRPGQWIKNAVVLAAFFFALGDVSQAAALRAQFAEATLTILAATALFCLLSSGVYVMNDIRDFPVDRLHPWKKSRPIAAGRISLGRAWLLAVLLQGIAVVGSYFLAPRLACVAGVYVILQVAYTFGFKKVALLDMIVISSGFVLRALAGAVALDVTISPWLLLCTFLLALFLGFCKRRHEKVLLTDHGTENRPILGKYDAKLLDQVISIVASATIVTYALYTLSPETVRKFGSASLGYTIPFVIFGIFRYLDLVYRHEQGNRPERLLLTDRPLIIDIILYGIAVLLIFKLS